MCVFVRKYLNSYNPVLFVIQLEKNIDYITFHDGVSEKSPLIYNLTGKMEVINIRGTKESMFIVYGRKYTKMDTGFVADIIFGNCMHM